MKLYLFLLVCFVELVDGLLSYYGIKYKGLREIKQDSLFFMNKFGLVGGIIILFFIQLILAAFMLLLPEIVADLVLMIMAGLISYAIIKNLILIRKAR